jgi:hypothetical protein
VGPESGSICRWNVRMSANTATTPRQGQSHMCRVESLTAVSSRGLFPLLREAPQPVSKCSCQTDAHYHTPHSSVHLPHCYTKAYSLLVCKISSFSLPYFRLPISVFPSRVAKGPMNKADLEGKRMSQALHTRPRSRSRSLTCSHRAPEPPMIKSPAGPPGN